MTRMITLASKKRNVGIGYAALLVTGFSLWLLTTLARRTEFTGLIADAYIYLLMADAFGGVAHGIDTLSRTVFASFPFPPLYPLALALGGGGSYSPLITHALHASFLAAGLGAFTLWYRTLGLTWTMSGALGLTLSVLPVTWLTALDIQSESLYVLLSGLTLLALGDRPLSRKRWFASGVCCGLTILTRTIGVALLPALLLHAWRVKQYREGVFAVGIALLGLIAWQGLRHIVGLESSYLDSSHGALHPSLAGYWPVMSNNLHALWRVAPQCFDFAPHSITCIVIGLIGVIASVTAIYRLWRGKADAAYAFSYLAIILLWPYPAHARRFLFVVLPILMGYAVLGIAALVRVRTSWVRGAVTHAVIVIFLLLALPTAGAMWREINQEPAIARMPSRYFAPSLSVAHTEMNQLAPIYELLATLPTEVPSDGCVSSTIPEQLMFYARRRAVALAESHGDEARIRQMLMNCPYLFMVATAAYPPDGLPPMYPYRVVEADLEVIAVRRANPHDVHSAVMAMLAYYSPAKK